jgi:hypothetical protein
VTEESTGAGGGSAAADENPDARVCVVATRPKTFAECRNGIYPAPRSYDRTRRAFDYMAFYRTAPTSAVTHYAPVTGRVEEMRDDGDHMTPERWATLIEPVSDERTVVVFELGDLVALDDPVTNDRNGVRGAWYCTLDALVRASTTSELAERSGE